MHELTSDLLASMRQNKHSPRLKEELRWGNGITHAKRYQCTTCLMEGLVDLVDNSVSGLALDVVCDYKDDMTWEEWMGWAQKQVSFGDIHQWPIGKTEYTVAIANAEVKEGRVRMIYALHHPDHEILFYGGSLEMICTNNASTIDSAMTLIGFLTLRPGDTDEEYFAGHTRRQLDWCVSPDASELSIIASDYEEGKVMRYDVDSDGTFWAEHIDGHRIHVTDPDDIQALADTFGYTDGDPSEYLRRHAHYWTHSYDQDTNSFF